MPSGLSPAALPTDAQGALLRAIADHPGQGDDDYPRAGGTFAACERRGWLGTARDKYGGTEGVGLTVAGATPPGA